MYLTKPQRVRVKDPVLIFLTFCSLTPRKKQQNMVKFHFFNLSTRELMYDVIFQKWRQVFHWGMVRATPWSPWKALEFNIWFQGCLKSPWKEEFYVKVLENNGNSLNFFGRGNNKGYIKNWAHILNLQNDFAKNFCSTCTFVCWVKSDSRTLYSVISFSMW